MRTRFNNITAHGAFLFFLVICGAITPAVRAQKITLDFTPLSLGNGSEVRFFSKPSGTVSLASLQNHSLVPSNRTDHGYVVSVDESSYQQDKNQRFVVDIYVQLKPDDASAPLYKFSAWEDAGGKFLDGWETFNGTLSVDNNKDPTAVRLPIHSRYSDNLQLSDNKTLAISMGSEGTPTVSVRNALKELRVSFPAKGITVEDRNCPKCWSSLKGTPGRLDLPPDTSTTIDLDLQPDAAQILMRNLLPPPADASPYQLAITVLSTAEKGGALVSQELDVPIQFKPAPQFIALSLVLGVIVGITMRALITRKVDWLDFAFQAILAFVVWLLLLVTSAKASILGYNLDPTALVAAGLITLVVAGGTSVGSKIAEAIRRP